MTIVLGLATAATLTVSAMALTTPSSIATTAANDRGGIVRGFYAAVNEAIATGETADLESVLAPDFVDRDPPPGTRADRAGFLRSVASLHQAAPSLHLEVDALAVDVDRVITRVSTRADDLTAIGVPMDARLRLWGPVDVFRVTGDKIVELWRASEGVSVIESIMDVDAEVTPDWSINRTLQIDRVTLAPGDSARLLATRTTRFARIEHGRAVVKIDSASSNDAIVRHPALGAATVPDEQSAPDSSLDLDQGDLVTIPGTVAVVFQADGPQPATLLITDLPIAKTAPQFEDHRRRDPEPNLATTGTLDPLIKSLSVTLWQGSARISVVRVTVAPGSVLSFHNQAGPVALAVESGTIAAESSTAPMLLFDQETGAYQSLTEASVTAGNNAMFRRDSAISLSATGSTPVTLLVYSVTPAES
jgi:hypothetical protein